MLPSVRHDRIGGDVVMERGRQVRALFKLVVVQVELLGHFAPALVVKVVVQATFVQTSLDLWFHHGSPCDPDSFLLVVTPVTIVPGVCKGEGETGD